jgi:hypothetical protein
MAAQVGDTILLMITFGPRSLAGFAIAGLLLAAGCGSENPPAASTGTQPVANQSATSTTTATTVDPAKVSSEVSTSFTAFFEHFKGDPALLEDGEQMKAGIAALGESAQASHVTVTVKNVKPLDAAGCEAVDVPSPCAEVKFDLNLDGNPVVADQTGYAVQQAGAWKVAKTTFCTLAGMGGKTPSGC